MPAPDTDPQVEAPDDAASSYGVRSLGNSEWFDRSAVTQPGEGRDPGAPAMPDGLDLPSSSPPKDPTEGDAPSRDMAHVSSRPSGGADEEKTPSTLRPDHGEQVLATSYDWPPSVIIRGRALGYAPAAAPPPTPDASASEAIAQPDSAAHPSAQPIAPAQTRTVIDTASSPGLPHPAHHPHSAADADPARIPSSPTSAISSGPGSISSLSRTVSPADSDLDLDLDLDVGWSDAPSGPASPTSSTASPPRRARGRGGGNGWHAGRSAQPFAAAAADRTEASAPLDSSRERKRGRESSYVFSRTHWAVREARERMEEQGGDVSLVLPTLALPDSSLLGSSRLGESGGGSAGGSRSPPRGLRHDTDEHATRGINTPLDPASPPSRHSLRILLSGTNRTANAFLKALAADSRVRVYRIRPAAAAGSTTRGRAGTQLRSGRRAGDGAYDVAVMRVAASASSAVAGDGACDGPSMREAHSAQNDLHLPEDAHAAPERMELLARIRVVANGQDGNLQRAVAEIEASHHRLNALLAPSASASSMHSEQAGDDLRRLVRGWARTASDEGSAAWYDLAVLTGDARYLAGRDIDVVNHLQQVVPTLCYPATLASRLAEHVEDPFFTLQAPPRSEGDRRASLDAPSSLGGPTPRCSVEGHISSYFASMHEDGAAECALAALVEHITTASTRTGQNAHRQREDAAVEAFVRWKEVQDDQPTYGPASASLESSATGPMPTLARAGANTDWESQLSRRHAARAERRPAGRKAAVTGPLALSLQQNVQTPTGFFGEGAWRGQAGRSQRPSESVIRMAFLDPLDRLRALVGNAPGPMSKTGWTVAFACVAAVVGLGCWWRLQTA